MFTKQETFDIVAKGLLAQGGPAYTDRCWYRAEMPDGYMRKCAAGLLISDTDYRPDMELCGVFEGNSVGIVIENAGHSVDLVYDLQRAHDRPHIYSSRNRSSKIDRMDTVVTDTKWLIYWNTAMRILAADHNLNADALNR